MVTGWVSILSVGGGWSPSQQHSATMIAIFLLAGAGCLSQPDAMTPDPDNCHVFYQCDVNPVALSCGDMMFNTEKQVCDWPHVVLQIRPECRNIQQIINSNHVGFPFERTMRMLSFYGDSSFNAENQTLSNSLHSRIIQELQKRLPGILNRKITNYVSRLNSIESFITTTTAAPTTTTTASSTTTSTTTIAPKRPESAPRSFFTYRSDAIPRQRPQPTPFKDLLRSISPSYTKQHAYDQQVGYISDEDTNTTAVELLPTSTTEASTTTTTSTTVTTTAAIPKVTTPPQQTHYFVNENNNQRTWNVARQRPFLRHCSQRSGGCGKPRRLILRKVRRKLILNEREKLQQRRNELRNDIPEASLETMENRNPVVQNQNEDIIERNEEKKNVAYEEAIAKLKSLVEEKKANQEYDGLRRAGKIVSVSYSTSSS